MFIERVDPRSQILPNSLPLRGTIPQKLDSGLSSVAKPGQLGWSQAMEIGYGQLSDRAARRSTTSAADIVRQRPFLQRSMFTHVMIGSNDLERAREFYDATFAAL